MGEAIYSSFFNEQQNFCIPILFYFAHNLPYALLNGFNRSEMLHLVSISLEMLQITYLFWKIEHFACSVQQFLNKVFPEGWIGRNGQIAKPAHSLALSSLEFFL